MILFALLVAHRVNSNCYKAQRRIYTKVAFTCVMDYTSLTGNFETEDFTMKIAVTYDNGNIFQHFGKTETFKVYEVEDNKVVSSEVIGSNGEGHGALAGLLAEQNVDVLICGGIGGGAQTALAEAGVELCSGAQGDADQAVEAYLKGELVSRGATCDHHHHEEGHSCGDHEAAAVADADHTLQWKERMLERNAVHITKEHSMTELSLILLMIVESRLSSYAVQDR